MFHFFPKVVAKALIRLLRSHKEIQAVVLNCIASMTSSKVRNNMFEPHLRNFFVRSSDPTHIKILKLEIITNLANAGNIGIILREFQSYITSQVSWKSRWPITFSCCVVICLLSVILGQILYCCHNSSDWSMCFDYWWGHWHVPQWIGASSFESGPSRSGRICRGHQEAIAKSNGWS